MFEQVVSDGVNLFITIVAIVIGFVSALGFIDERRNRKSEDKRPID